MLLQPVYASLHSGRVDLLVALHPVSRWFPDRVKGPAVRGCCRRWPSSKLRPIDSNPLDTDRAYMRKVSAVAKNRQLKLPMSA